MRRHAGERHEGNQRARVVACACAAMVTLACFAQGPEAAAPDAGAPTDPVAAYLERQGLDEVLAAHLRQRLEKAGSTERVEIAERLGELYARMLSNATTPEVRDAVERQSRVLLRDVPEADSSELRLNLAKASYLNAEELAERFRLRLSTDDEAEQARAILRAVGPAFADLASRLDAQVKLLEKRESTGRDADMESLRDRLSDARRLHSLARYYAGWSLYYEAFMTGSPARASAAAEQFGVILNAAPNRPPTVERVAPSLLRFDHVARAALGCAMCASLRGEHVEAVRWMDLLMRSDDVSEGVRSQLFTREIQVLAAAQRWSDVDVRVRERRGVGAAGGAIKPLTPLEARAVAIAALEHGAGSAGMPRLAQLAEEVASAAMSDLVSQKQIAQVVDLVQRFGTSSLGADGFIVVYVRGLRAYEDARTAHRAAVADAAAADEPTRDPALVNAYRQAADLLGSSLGAPDSMDFPVERSRTRTRMGLARYYAGDYVEAVEAFVKAADEVGGGEARGDALWYALVALDRAIEEGAPSRIPERDRLAVVYLREFPATENAARLLLRQTNAQGMTDGQVVEVLLKVPSDSALYVAAQRHASTLLYRIFRSARQGDRDFAALRFTTHAEPLLRVEQTAALATTDQPGRDAAAAVVVRVRQLADALLSTSGPDPEKAEQVLQALDAVAAFHAIDLKPHAAELAFRRLQIAAIRGDEDAITRISDQLRALQGPFSEAADRLLLRRAQRLLDASPMDVRSAREAVRFGLRVLDQANAAGAASVRDTIAKAGALLWEIERDQAMRDVALRMEREQQAAGVRTLASLRRHAQLAEAAGATEESGRAWAELSNGVDAGSVAWFEARYESIRLLATLDPVKARAALDQHRVLYPMLGPAPWDEKFRTLDGQVPAAATPASGNAPPGSATP